MAQVKDPVCGMMIDPDTAAGQATHQGTTYYFCSTQCLRQFQTDPARYVGTSPSTGRPGSASDVQPEQHEPPYTKSGGITAPKFGAAGSGGLEHERLPEAHSDREDDRTAR
jgi:YHS domain-containing protein